MKWSQQAWAEAQPVYEAILQLPFVKELAAGTLPIEKFRFYLGQDALYLGSYCRALAHVASRLSDPADVEAFLHFATDGIAVERALHESYLKGARPATKSPTCMLYTSVEESMAYEPVEVEAASLLPCFWVYQKVGEHILAQASSLESNPYRAWIETYGDPSFEAASARAIAICDRLAGSATEAVRRRMTEMFTLCTRLEWMFWDSAYSMEKWKI